jgi:5-methyltetrahydrofolate--homocysteine methyltransferase
LLNANEKERYTSELNEKYQELRDSYGKEQEKLMSLEEARKKKPNLWED